MTDEQEDRAARTGGEAAGGNAMREGDVTNPKAAAKRAEASNAAMAEAGFGDHQGGRLRGPDEKGPEPR